MEHYFGLHEASLQKLRLADHILNEAYPTFKDSKLLLVATENLYLALHYGKGTLIEYASLVNEGNSKLIELKLREKYQIPRVYFTLLKELRTILLEHKKSPIEFERKESYIICSDKYTFKKLTPMILKYQYNKSKEFINIISNIISKDLTPSNRFSTTTLTIIA